ncbi:MAG: mannose-6-phosphate isomerase [Firmicutes bacterium HGW-Firmicutes-1]|jgi:mannose-6-phosphate isomerase|nr:MAG: mannose-6-phosphate isomerase [Firmicutes bacterium HGW-Firmicutes-1]
MYLLLLEPDYKERVWGGQKLNTFLKKEIPFTHTGESWEVACHENGNSIIRNGSLKGMTLKAAIDTYGEELIGNTINKGKKFPLLLKYIDAKDLLSVQVHPDDEYAFVNENGELGKNEAWYILDAEIGSKLYVGLKEGVTKKIFVEAFQQNCLETVLNELEVKKGDVINIPAGLIHAIGTGILLAEVQQNSDTTYRVYDWGRVGLDGEMRELHIEKSLEVIDFEGLHSKSVVEGTKQVEEGYEMTYYIKNKYFSLDKISVSKSYNVLKPSKHFELFMCVEGNAKISCNEGAIDVVHGDSFMVPASIEEYTITGSGAFIRAYVPC